MPSGPTLRPDRVNFSKTGRVSVLDYKTSDPKKADIEQIKTYKRSLIDFGYNKIDSYLVYINSDIQVVRINWFFTIKDGNFSRWYSPKYSCIPYKNGSDQDYCS